MKHIIVFGDSISNGQHLSVHKGWVHLMAEVLGDRAVVENRSVNGNTTRMALERMPHDVLQDPPDILIIQFGQNDANRWETDNGVRRVGTEAFIGNLKDILYRAQVFNVLPMLLTNPPVLKESLFLPRDNHEYNIQIREVAGQHSVPLVDIEILFQMTKGLMLDDGIHPNEAGHRVYARAVIEALERNGYL